MRDLIVSLFILLSLPIAFRRPFYGLLLFTMLAYMRLQDMTWGFARFQRWSYYVAIVTVAGFLLAREERTFMVSNLRTWLMIALVVLVGASMLGSQYLVPRDFEIFIEYVKIIGVALFTTGIVRTRDHLRILVWVIALSFGFHGAKSGVAFVLSRGTPIIQGPGGMLSDNNDFALALCMGLPLLLHLGLSEHHKLVRRVALCIVPLQALTIVATHSRGAFLAMSVTVLVLVWRSPNRIAGFAILFFIGIAGLLAVPQSYKERISSIGTYQEDASARGRIQAWKVAGNMIVAKPFLGVGYAKFQYNYKTYDTNAVTVNDGTGDQHGTRVAHNSYLQIWAEVGTPAFFIYLSLIGLSFFDIWSVRREARRRYHSSWILSYCTMFEASLVAFMVGAVFLNRAQFDLFYHFVALIVVFGRVARTSMAEAPAIESGSASRGSLQQLRLRGFGPGPAEAGFARSARRSGFDKGPAFGSS